MLGGSATSRPELSLVPVLLTDDASPPPPGWRLCFWLALLTLPVAAGVPVACGSSSSFSWLLSAPRVELHFSRVRFCVCLCFSEQKDPGTAGVGRSEDRAIKRSTRRGARSRVRQRSAGVSIFLPKIQQPKEGPEQVHVTWWPEGSGFCSRPQPLHPCFGADVRDLKRGEA